MMKVFVLLAIIIIPVPLSVAGNGHKHAKHSKHGKSHKHYRNIKPYNPSTQGSSWS